MTNHITATMKVEGFEYTEPATILTIARPLPVGVGRVRQVFGANVPDYLPAGFAGHEGLDYSCVIGKPVLACTDGKVIFAGLGTRGNKAYGIYVILDHGKFRSWYCHLSGVMIIAGQFVYQGQKIGLTGNTGNSTGPHLHFAIQVPTAKNGSKGFIDPWALRVIFGDA